jgi:hypothetical protein
MATDGENTVFFFRREAGVERRVNLSDFFDAFAFVFSKINNHETLIDNASDRTSLRTHSNRFSVEVSPDRRGLISDSFGLGSPLAAMCLTRCLTPGSKKLSGLSQEFQLVIHLSCHFFGERPGWPVAASRAFNAAFNRGFKEKNNKVLT